MLFSITVNASLGVIVGIELNLKSFVFLVTMHSILVICFAQLY